MVVHFQLFYRRAVLGPGGQLDLELERIGVLLLAICAQPQRSPVEGASLHIPLTGDVLDHRQDRFAVLEVLDLGSNLLIVCLGSAPGLKFRR